MQAGALIAVYLAKRGFKVDVFEARKGDFQVSFDSVGSVLEGRGGRRVLSVSLSFEPFQPQDLTSNSPKCLLYNSYDFSLENLVLEFGRIFFFILVTCQLDIVLMM